MDHPVSVLTYVKTVISFFLLRIVNVFFFLHTYNSGHASERDFIRIDLMGKCICI